MGDATQVGLEIPADKYDPTMWKAVAKKLRESPESYDFKLPSGICDYALYRENGEILADMGVDTNAEGEAFLASPDNTKQVASSEMPDQPWPDAECLAPTIT